MIFVTLGSQKFQFNRVLKYLDHLTEKNILREEVYAQIGHSSYTPIYYPYDRFINREVFFERISLSNTVITHAGTGAIVSALKMNKKIIAVPRLKKYGEHVDDHQLEIAKIFQNEGYVLLAENLDDLEDKLSIMNKGIWQPKQYHRNTEKYISFISTYLKENFNEGTNDY